MEAMEQGGIIAWSILAVLVIMSVGSFYILFTKLLEQNKIMRQYNTVRSTFWRANTLSEGASKLEKNNPLGMIALQIGTSECLLTFPRQSHRQSQRRPLER